MRITASYAVLTLLLALTPRSALACSWAGGAILSSLPHPGDLDVPIDVAPIIRGYWDQSSVKWEAEDGTPVEFNLTRHVGASATGGEVAELVPVTPLQPNTRYVVSAWPMGGGNLDPDLSRLEFKTGSASADSDSLRAPTLEPTILTDFVSGCISAAAIGCMSLGSRSLLLEVDDTKGNLLLRDVVTGEVTVHIPKNPGCIRAWTRSASGKLSDVTELCGSALSKRPIRNGDLDFLTCSLGTSPVEEADPRDGGPSARDGEDDSGFGCMAVRPAGGGGGLCGLLLIAALSVMRRIRRGSRRLPA